MFLLHIINMYNKNKGDIMDVIISNSSDKPIYQQIMAQMKKMILSGELQEGDALPSMRLLAKELRISVITTKRAYEELEREGFIVSMTGRGSFVTAKNIHFIKEEHLRTIEGLIKQIIEIADAADISEHEISAMLELEFKEDR